MYLIFLSFFFSCLLFDFLVLISPSSFWGLVSNIFFFFLFFPFLTCCLSFNIWGSSFPNFFWMGCRIFFLSLELSSLLSVVFLFSRGSTVVVLFCFLIEVLIDHLTFSLSHLKQQSPNMDFHHS